MNTIKTVLLGSALSLVFPFAANAQDATPDTDALRREIAELRGQIAAMNRDHKPSELDKARARETKRLVREVLADAESRRSLRNQSPLSLDVSGFAVTRFQYADGGGSDKRHEFSIPYARLQFSGDVYDFGYVVSGEFSDQTSGNFDLVDAYITRDFGFADFKVGQFVSSFYKGYTDSPLDQLNGEYTLIANTYGQGRSQGIEFSKDFGWLDLTAGYNDGFNSANGASVANEYGINVRGDVDFGGGLSFGAGYSYQSLTASDYSTFTVDAGYAGGGWDFGVSYVARDLDTNGGWSDNYGIVGSVAYQCTEDLQGFFQYENGKVGAGTDLNLLTVGANYDLAKGVRWTTSVGYAFDAVDGAWDFGRTGWSASSDSGQYVVSTQIAISF